MSERVQVQAKNSTTAAQPAEPQFQERPFTDERYQPVASASTISASSPPPPKIAPPSFNLMNMPIFAPSPGANIQSGGIQRQEQEEKNQDLQLKEESNAVSQAEGEEEKKNQDLQLKEESNAVLAPEEGEEQKNQDLQLKEESNAVSREEAPQFDLQLKLIQTKLTVGKPGDKYEQEADNMAAKVMAMPDSAIQQSIQRTSEEEKEQVQTSQVANSITRMVQRQTAEDSEELQMKPGLQQAAKGGSKQASDNIESHLSSSKGGGSPLPDDVRNFMEPRLGADLSKVRVHTDSTAVQMNKELGAQAFAHGSDIYFGAGKSPGKDELTAHELTHTMQQGAAMRMNKEVRRQPQQEEEQETLQAKEISSLQQDRQGLKSLANSSSRLKPSINNIASPLKRTLAISPEIDFRAVDDSKQETPLNKESSFKASETQGETLAAKKLPSHTPNLSLNKELRQKPQEEEQEETLDEPIQAKQFTNSSPFNNKNSIQRQPLAVSSVSPRIQGDFLGIGNPIDKIKGAIAGFAKQLPGYPILTLILGKDPISDAPVQRNATNLVRGLLSLVPNGENIFNNLQQSGALQKAFDWFNGEVAKLNLTWDAIKGLFGKALNSLGIGDALNPIGAFEKIKNVFLEPIGRIKNFAVAAGTKVMEFAFEGFLNMAGGAGAKVMGILRKAGGVFTSILKDPVAFCGNLVGAVRGGFQKFSGNVATHLKNGLTGWLFGALAGAGLTLPAQFDLKGIVSIVLQVCGATYERLRGKLANKIGEQKVSRLEKTFDFLRSIVTGGLAAAWQKISEFAGNLQEMVIGGIKEWVMHSVITAAITKLISMFNPAGAIIQAAMAIYNTVMFFIERGSQIAALAEAVFNSIGNIAAGNVAGAANYVEQTMGRSLPVMISFLARLIGLGGISEHILNVIKKIQTPIENALNKLANFIVEKGKSLLGKGENNRNQDRNYKNEQKEETNESKAVERKVEFDWSKIRTNFKSKDRANHSIFVKVEGCQKIIMVASQEQRLKEFLVSVNGKINQTQNSNNKQRLIQNQTEAEENYQKALARVNELKKLEQKGQLNDDQEKSKKKLEDEIIKFFNKLGENLKELGLGAGELNLTTKIQVDRQNSVGRTEQITADPLTPIPGNTKGSEPPRGQTTIPPGWDHLVKAKNLGVSNFNFDEWVRMHLIHEHLHGPGESYNLVPAPINVNTPAYNLVEKPAVESILKDPEAILWYQTTVEYYPEEPSKAYLSNFPKKITIKWFQYSVDVSGKLTKNSSSEKYYEKDNIKEPPELSGTTTGTPTMYISNISRTNMRKLFGNNRGERLNTALAKVSSLANLTVEELKTIYSQLQQESISNSSRGRDDKGYSEKNAAKDLDELQKIHGTQQDIDGIKFTIDIKG